MDITTVISYTLDPKAVYEKIMRGELMVTFENADIFHKYVRHAIGTSRSWGHGGLRKGMRYEDAVLESHKAMRFHDNFTVPVANGSLSNTPLAHLNRMKLGFASRHPSALKNVQYDVRYLFKELITSLDNYWDIYVQICAMMDVEPTPLRPSQPLNKYAQSARTYVLLEDAHYDMLVGSAISGLTMPTLVVDDPNSVEDFRTATREEIYAELSKRLTSPYATIPSELNTYETIGGTRRTRVGYEYQ